MGFLKGLTKLSMFRWLLIAVVGLVAVPFAITEYQLQRTYENAGRPLKLTGLPNINEGARLSKLYGCTSCHGADYRGLRYNDDPKLVQQYAPNLTIIAPKHDDIELAHAIRYGVSVDGERALWGMPSATFTPVTDAEMASVLAHLRSLPAGGGQVQRHWPGIEARIAMLRGLFAPNANDVQISAPALVAKSRLRTPLLLGPKHAKGRHIAATVCSECHGSDLAGNAQEGGTDLIVAGGYDLEAFRTLMRTGMPPDGRDLGLMRETAQSDLKVFTDNEIDALHGYLVARALRF